MTIIDPRLARDERGQKCSMKHGIAAHSAPIKRSKAIVPIMNFSRRGQREKPYSAAPDSVAARNDVTARNDMAANAQAVPESTQEQARILEALLDRLDDSLQAYSQSSHATAVINDDLNPKSVVSELASIAKVMLQSTRIIAEEMNRKESLTRILEANLADAQRSAQIDYLTGLPNRRAFEAFLKSELELAATRGEAICVAFVDLDHFKAVNDSHGHEAGDQVLRVVGQILATISDDKCHVARHGGEEFVVLFRGKSLQEAAAVLDNAREALASWNLIGKLPPLHVTFSGGISDISAFATIGDALKAADEALYAAKSSGRNRISLAGVDISQLEAA
jgi:diguanylate cyclase (GGDEF)-like protein